MRRLGLARTGTKDRHVDGLVEVINDATSRHDLPLDHDRLWRWQSALFPGGTSGIRRIAVGRYRDHIEAMQIVGGARGKREIVHFEAPPSKRVPTEMKRFLKWFAETTPMQGKAPKIDGLARAAIAHLWFETIHPFEDGNGRIGRAIVDLAIAQDHRAPVRLYSLSREWLESRKGYYDALNEAQAQRRVVHEDDAGVEGDGDARSGRAGERGVAARGRQGQGRSVSRSCAGVGARVTRRSTAGQLICRQ
jgi:Fic family protein